MKHWRAARKNNRNDGALVITVGSRADVSKIDAVYAAVGWTPAGGIRSRDNFLLARRGHRVVGVLMYWVDDDPEALPQAWTQTYGHSTRLVVQEIAVLPDYQRSGVGRALIQAAASTAVRAGIQYLFTWPSPRGTPQQRDGRMAFFGRCGMSVFQPESQVEMVGLAEDVLAAAGGSAE